jgi:hypothetical protein
MSFLRDDSQGQYKLIGLFEITLNTKYQLGNGDRSKKQERPGHVSRSLTQQQSYLLRKDIFPTS